MSALEDGDTLETAFHRLRIDASEGALVIGDTSLDEEIHQALQARFDYIQQQRLTLPFKYACPSGVLRSGNTSWGATEISSPWADAVASEEGEGSRRRRKENGQVLPFEQAKGKA